MKLGEILEKLKKEGKKLAYFVDMGGELYIYPQDDEEHPIYEGITVEYIENMMDYFGIRDDN